MARVAAWLLHRAQVAIANHVFSRASREVQRARRVIEAMPDGRGVRTIDGKMQDAATWKQCRFMVASL
jgi:malyl-CoA/(S)-citramalyl-CoA lyase